MAKRRLAFFLVLCMIFQVLVPGGISAYGAPGDTDEFDQMRVAYYHYLTGGDDYDSGDEAVKQKIELIEQQAAQYGENWYEKFLERLDQMDFEAEETDPFLIQVGQRYGELYNMALACRIPGTSFYGDEETLSCIVKGIEEIYQRGYDEDYVHTANWWRYKIGIPGTVVDLVVLMYDDMTPEQIGHQMDTLHAVIPVVNDTEASWQGENQGTNLIWKAFRVMLCGIITKDAHKMEMARDALSEGFRYKDGSSQDGMYPDGSFIFHSWIPYNMGYGLSQMADVASIMRVLGGSSWESEDPDQQNLYDWVETAFEPFLYHGYTMPMVSGREVSRNDCIENGGFTFTKTLLMLLEFAPEEYLDDYQSMIKSNLEAYEKDGKLLEFYKALPLYYIPACSRIFEDSSIEPWEIKTEAKVYGNMDRALQRNPDYSVGIAMHSKRTKIFESNDEWVNGFHTANGMVYLTTKDDPLQFGGDFFFTSDPYKLPGTTVNTRKRDLSNLGNDNPNIPKPWVMNDQGRLVGGSVLGSNMTVGMYLTDLKPKNSGFTQAETTMSAQKSWFLFDDEIVALGSDIRSSDADNRIETIIENRKLAKDNSNVIIADGEDVGEGKSNRETLTWANIEGTGGYYFPEGEKLTLERCLRSANTLATNKIYGKENDVRTDHYFSIVKDHGKQPDGDTYAYVLLPGKDAAETKDYAEQPDIRIIANEKEVQMAQEETLGLTAANFWGNETASAGMIRCNRKASVMMEEKDGKLTAAVSDSTMENKGSIYMEINRSAGELVSGDDRVRVVRLEPTILLEINCKDAKGAAIGFTFDGVGEGIDEEEFLSRDDAFENSLLAVMIENAEQELRKLADEAEIGTKNGMVLESAVTRLLETADELKAIAEKADLTAEETAEALDLAEAAKKIFETSKIADEVTIMVSEDTYIRLGTKPESLNENHGSDKMLAVKTQKGWLDGNRQILLKFHIGDNGRTISSAKLYLTGSPTAAHVVDKDCEPFFIQEVADNSWKENTVTGRTAPSIGEIIARGETPPKTKATLMYDVTDYIKEKYADGVVSMAVVQDAASVEGDGGAYYTVAAKENGSDYPILVIEYDRPAGDVLKELEEKLRKTAAEAEVGPALGEYPQSAVDRLLEAADEIGELRDQEAVTAQEIKHAKELTEMAERVFRASRIVQETVVNVEEDTFIRSGAPNGSDYRDKNYGLEKVGEIKTDNGWPAGNRRMLLKFLLGSSELPVKKATLYLTGTPQKEDVQNKDCEPMWIYGVEDSSWSETTVTYHTAPEIGDVIAKGDTPPKTEAAMAYDITEYIKGYSEGGMVSMAVIQEVPEGTGAFYKAYTKENGSKAARIEIEYDLEECQVTVEATPSNAGKVTGNGKVLQRTKHTVVAEAKEGYHFTEWTCKGDWVSSDPEYTFTVLEDTALIAWFEEGEPVKYKITAKASPSNAGKVTGSGTATEGTRHTVTAVPKDGWVFVEWLQDGDSVSDEAEYTFEVTEDAVLWAMFEEEEEPDEPDGPDGPDDPDGPDEPDDPDDPDRPEDPDKPARLDDSGSSNDGDSGYEIPVTEVLSASDLIGADRNAWFTKNGWWYYLDENGKPEKGWFLYENSWYFMNQNGVMQTGWVKTGEKWYYLGTDGRMKTGWITDRSFWYYLKDDGAMATGWILSNGKWYYLNADGSMAADQNIEGYYVDRNGIWQENEKSKE